MLVCLLSLVLWGFSVRAENARYTPLPEQYLVPLSYDVILLPWMETKDWLLDGSTLIEFIVMQPIVDLHIHFEHSMESIFVMHNGQEVPINNMTYDEATTQWKLSFEEPLETTSIYQLVATFSYEVQQYPYYGGIFRRQYVEEEENRYLISTQFEDIAARNAFPCFDEPNLKAKFNLTLGHRETYKALANTVVESTEPIVDAPGWVWSKFQETEEMSTYLVAITIGILDSNTVDSSVPVSVYTPPTRLQDADLALRANADIIEYFGSLLNFSYTFPKMDVVPIEDHPAGAMENWGLILFYPDYFYYNSEEDFIATSKLVISVCSHELAHQWFGNLVTMDWWSQLWLNEGITTFYEYWGADHFDPWGQWLSRIAVLGSPNAYEADTSSYSRPISEDVFDETFEYPNFRIVYDKGSVLNRMMLSFLGEAAYFSGARDYLQRFAYGNVRNDDYWSAMQDAIEHPLPLSVKEIMDTFTLQPGVPLVRVKRSYSGSGRDTVRFSQQRFLLNAEDDGTRYVVPFKYATEELEDSPLLWLTEDTMEVELPLPPASWLLVNPRRESYMIVLYDDENYDRIIEQLNNDHTKIPALMRGTLFSDLSFVLEKYLVSVDVGVQMTNYLSREIDEIAWYGMLRLHRVLLTRDPPGSSYEPYFLNKVAEALTLAVEESENSSTPEKYEVVIELLYSLLEEKQRFFEGQVWQLTTVGMDELRNRRRRLRH